VNIFFIDQRIQKSVFSYSMIQTIQILVFTVLKWLFYYVELRIYANLKTKILVRLLPHLAFEFRRLCIIVQIY